MDINEHNIDRTDDEAEVAQVHSLHLNMNAIAEHQRRMAAAGPSQSHCEDCGEEIPEARQKYVTGCKTCIECQRTAERRKRVTGL